jgi:hypothetical protein
MYTMGNHLQFSPLIDLNSLPISDSSVNQSSFKMFFVFIVGTTVSLILFRTVYKCD